MDAAGWPEENQLIQGPSRGAVCQICQSAPSEPIVKTSSRPSAFFPTPGTTRTFVLGGFVIGSQLLHDLSGMVCQMCQNVPSVPTLKTSRRPSVFFPTFRLTSLVDVGVPS